MPKLISEIKDEKLRKLAEQRREERPKDWEYTEILIGAFSFGATPEGEEFWCNVEQDRITQLDTTSDIDMGEVMHTGMALRDWLAGLAMQGFLSNPFSIEQMYNTSKGVSMPEEIANLAYEYADAMLLHRTKSTDNE